jgi:hypothetical protein
MNNELKPHTTQADQARSLQKTRTDEEVNEFMEVCMRHFT